MTDKELLEAAARAAGLPTFASGDRVRMLVDIWDDGEEHHPPGWLARKGEVLFVKAISGDGGVSVAHEGNPGSFHVHMAEFETYNATLKGRHDQT